MSVVNLKPAQMNLIKMIINQTETHTAKFHIHTSSSESLWHPRKRYIRRRALFQNGGGHTPHHTRHKTIPRHRPAQVFFMMMSIAHASFFNSCSMTHMCFLLLAFLVDHVLIVSEILFPSLSKATLQTTIKVRIALYLLD